MLLILVRELESWNVDVKVSDPWADADEVSEEYGIVLHDQNDLAGVDAVNFSLFPSASLSCSSAVFLLLFSPLPSFFFFLPSLSPPPPLKDAGFTVFRL